MSRIVKTPVSSYSPFYGCFIMAAAALIFGGIIAWSAYTLFRQSAEIDTFTVAEPVPFPAFALATDAETSLIAKGTALQKALAAGTEASLDLSLDELNALVAKAPDLGHGTYTDIVRFTGTQPDNNLLLADINLPLNPLPFSGKGKRYLVGKAHFAVSVGENGPDLRIIHLEAPGKTIPAGFVQSQEFWTWLAPYHKDTQISTTLKALRTARVTPNGLHLSTRSE